MLIAQRLRVAWVSYGSRGQRGSRSIDCALEALEVFGRLEDGTVSESNDDAAGGYLGRDELFLDR